jgi:hypothetical protein
MHRETLLEHLARADRHVFRGALDIAQQREVIARLGDGPGRLRAAELLEELEKTQAMHIADRDRLRRELTQFDSK